MNIPSHPTSDIISPTAIQFVADALTLAFNIATATEAFPHQSQQIVAKYNNAIFYVRFILRDQVWRLKMEPSHWNPVSDQALFYQCIRCADSANYSLVYAGEKENQELVNAVPVWMFAHANIKFVNSAIESALDCLSEHTRAKRVAESVESEPAGKRARISANAVVPK